MPVPYERPEYRPVVNIPGQKPYVCGRTFDLFSAAQSWAAGFVQMKGPLIKSGSSVQIGPCLFAVLETPTGHRLQILGRARDLRKEAAKCAV